MIDSNKLQRRQTTKYLGRLEDVEVELQDNQGASSNLMGKTKRERENGELIDTSNLLEEII